MAGRSTVPAMLPVMVTDMDAGLRPRPIGLLSGLLFGQKLEFVRLGHAVVLGFSGGSLVLIVCLARGEIAVWGDRK